MATYKVIQDIEAEDKLVGPLTLRQFIYGIVAAASGYFCFLGLVKQAWPLIVVFLPIMLAAGFFAFPWGRDQPTEVWALAKIRFLMFPRRRIWNQSGTKELVTITAPKRTDTNYTNGLSQTEVKSRLQALADTIDSRGWAIKNAVPGAAESDRLIDINSMPHEVASNYARPEDDILDEANNPTAANFEQMIENYAAGHHQQLIKQALASTQPPVKAGQAGGVGAVDSQSAEAPPRDNFWFMNQAAGANAHVSDAEVITPSSNEAPLPGENTPGSRAAEAELTAELKASKKAPVASNSHMRTIRPLSETPAPRQQSPRPSAGATATLNANDNAPKDDRIEESRRAVERAQLASNNDLNIATIARQANHKSEPDEVVISLHND